MARLSMGGEPMFALDFADAPNPDAFDYRPERYILHTHGISGGDHIAHALQSVSGPTQAVQLRNWQPNIGGVRARLSGADQAYWIARVIPRGMLCRLKIGFAGMEYNDWGEMGIYQFKGLSGARNNWQMEFGDFFAYIQSRYATTDYKDLFPDAGQQTELTASYATADTSITVADNSIFTMDSDSGARGLLHVQPDSGDPFYLKFSATPGSTTVTVDASDVIGTTRSAITASGSTDHQVTALGYINGDLPTILEKILFRSTSSVGTMPADSNVGLHYDRKHVDQTDWVRQANRLAVIGGFTADFIASTPLINPWAAVSDFFDAFGMWLVMRQGAMSFRTAWDIAADSAASIYYDDEITDADIVSVENQQLYHPDAREEYQQVTFPLTAYHDTDGSTVRTMPTVAKLSHRSKDHVYDVGSATTNRTNASVHLRKRLLKWYTRLPMGLSLNLLGWRWAGLVPGDVVRIHSDRIIDIMNPVASLVSPFKTISGEAFMVTSVAPDFQNFTTSIDLARLPDRPLPYIG